MTTRRNRQPPTPLRDLTRGMRVHVNTHPGTITRIRGQHNPYTAGYVTVTFDHDPQRPATYPWRDVTPTTPAP